MKTQRKNFVLTFGLILLLALTGLAGGCNWYKTDQPADVSKSGDTITVTDCISRNVTIPAHPPANCLPLPESVMPWLCSDREIKS